jgi:phosphoribosylamine-glycine ligase
MKYVFVSKFGDSFFLAYLLKELKHDVYFYVETNRAKKIGSGMGITLVDDFYQIVRETDKDKLILIFDQTGLGEEAEFLMGLGYHVYGASAIADKLEENRSYATKLLSEIMPVPPTKTFTDFGEAKRFLQDQDDEKRFVFKPEGEDTPSDWTYVSRDVPDLLRMLDYYKENWSLPEIKFELQTFIKGIECDFSGYFSHSGKFIENSFVWYYEDKKFLNGNLGPAVGCADALQYFTTSKEPFFKAYLSKLVPFLRKNKFSGQFSINTIYEVETKKFYALEISPRCGYDSFQNEIFHLVSRGKDPALLIRAVALGEKLPADYFDTKLYNFDIRISIPPYPNDEPGTPGAGVTIEMDKSIKKNFLYGDVMYNPKTHKIECTGADDVVGTLCAQGSSVVEAISILYMELAPKLNIANVQYRTDGGRRVLGNIMQLQQDKKILPRKDGVPIIIETIKK